MFCFGNLMRESGVVERLSDTVQNALINIVTIFLRTVGGGQAGGGQVPAAADAGILVLG